MKPLSLASAIASGLAISTVGHAATTDFIIRVPTTDKFSTWSGVSPLIGNWQNVGGQFNCSSWSPNEDTVDFGDSYLQSQTCDQRQERQITPREEDSFSGEVRELASYTEDRVVVDTNSRSAVGTRRNWVDTSSTYTNWTDTGTTSNYSGWSPVIASQTADFSQTRSYQMAQTRLRQDREQDTVTGDIRNDGAEVTEHQQDTRSESRNIDVSATSYSDVGGHYNCGSWAPTPDTVDYGTNYTQSRSCQQNQSRTWSYRSGGSTLESRVEARTISETETQAAVGTKQNWIAHTSTFTNWTNSGGRYSYSAWSPAAGNQTSNYNQSASYQQNQTRTEQQRERDTISGQVRNVGSPIPRSQTVSGTETRSITVSGSGWRDSGGHYNCGSWSPGTGTVDWNVSFTQTRSCKQNQTYTYTHKSGSTTIHTRNLSRTLDENETRTATGTKTVIVAASSTYTPWSTYNTVYGSWTPAKSTQTSNFTQSRTVTHYQERYEQKRQTRNGVVENVGDPIRHTQTVNGTNQTQTITVSASGWTNNGALYNCTSYSPATSTVNSGQVFTQSRSCTEPIKRTYSFSGGGSHVKTSTRTITQTRQATGTKVTKTCAFDPAGFLLVTYYESTGQYEFHTGTWNSYLTTSPRYGKYTPGAMINRVDWGGSTGTFYQHELCEDK